MKYINITAFTLAISLSGCSTVTGPSGAKFDLNTVCNTSAKSRCSPTVGRKLPLLKQQIILETYESKDEDGKAEVIPKLDTYLGTITQRKVFRFGEPGAYCGDDTVSTNPFEQEDFTKPVYINNATIAETFGNYSSASLEADITGALSLAGVTKPVLDRLKDDIKIEANKLSRGVSASTVKFVEYRIKEETLRKLEAANKSNSVNKDITRFKSCINILLSDTGKGNKGWRLYQSITGFIVPKNTSSFGKNSSFSGEFRAKLKSEIESAITEGTQPDIITAVPTIPPNPVSEKKSESTQNDNFDVKTTLSDNGCNITPPAAGSENEDILEIEATYKSYRCARTTGSSEPYFVVLGVSFWQSPRYPKIR